MKDECRPPPAPAGLAASADARRPRDATTNTSGQAGPERLPAEDLLVLEDVARRLARSYPPDWLERNGQQLHGATLAASFVMAVVLGLAWGPWWTCLLPLLLPSLLLVLLPRWLFRREAGRPRWAHPLAQLDPQERALLERIALQAGGSVPGGDRVYEIRRRARGLIGCRDG